MELTRDKAIAFCIAVIGALFAFLTYIERSWWLAAFGIASLIVLWVIVHDDSNGSEDWT